MRSPSNTALIWHSAEIAVVQSHENRSLKEKRTVKSAWVPSSGVSAEPEWRVRLRRRLIEVS